MLEDKSFPEPEFDIESSDDKKFYQKDRMARDSEGCAIYKKLCLDMNLADECLYYHNGFKSIRVEYVDNEFKLNIVSYGEKVLQQFVPNNNWQALNQYIIRYKKFLANPYLTVLAYLTEENLASPRGFVWRGDLSFLDKDQMILRATNPRVEVDTLTGEIRCLTPIRMPIDKKNDYVEELLRIIFPKPEEYNAFVDFLSLYSFENRYGLAKPTFVMYGTDRTTGKNLTFEMILGSIYEGQITPLPPNYDSFTGYLEKKFVYIDENNEASLDPIHLYNFLKKMSGQRYSPINKKGVDSKTKLNGAFFGIASNEKPLNMRDFVHDASQNQFLVINTIGTKHQQISEFKEKISKLGYGGLQDFMERCMGNFIFTVLYENYMNMKIEAKKTGFRYGMNIPIFSGLVKLLNLSVTSSDKGCIQILDNLVTGNRNDYSLTTELGWHFAEFKNKENKNENGFLSYKLAKSLCRQEKINDTSFYLFLDKYKLLKSDKFRRYVYGSKPTGVMIDFGKLVQIIENNAWMGRVEGYDTDDKGLEPEDNVFEGLL